MTACLFFCPDCLRTFTWPTTCPTHGCHLVALPFDHPLLGGKGEEPNPVKH